MPNVRNSDKRENTMNDINNNVIFIVDSTYILDSESKIELGLRIVQYSFFLSVYYILDSKASNII